MKYSLSLFLFIFSQVAFANAVKEAADIAVDCSAVNTVTQQSISFRVRYQASDTNSNDYYSLDIRDEANVQNPNQVCSYATLEHISSQDSEGRPLAQRRVICNIGQMRMPGVMWGGSGTQYSLSFSEAGVTSTALNSSNAIRIVHRGQLMPIGQLVCNDVIP